MSLIFWPTSPSMDCNTGIGGKANNLFRMISQGLPVPAWFCVSAERFDEFLAPIVSDIDVMVSEMAIEDAIDVSERVKLLVSTQHLDPKLVVEVRAALDWLGDNKFSVRSSADLEDSTELSFAGLFDTYLNTPSDLVADRIKKCWLSAFNAGSLVYLKKHNLSSLDLGMGVVIQCMVDSVKSGILFQVNPSGRLNELVVVAGFGLGEGVVADQVPVDTFFYDRYKKTVRKSISDKTHKVVYSTHAESGVSVVDVDPDQRTDEALTDEELQQLLVLSETLEGIYDSFQDVEWAFDSLGKLHILQSRPITSIPNGKMQYYDNSNISESYPGITQPLTISFVRTVYDKMFYYACRSTGFSEKDLESTRPAFETLVENIQGRVFYNMSSWYSMMMLLPFASSLMIPALEDALGTNRSVTSQRSKKSLVKSWAKCRVLIRFIMRYVFYSREFRSYDHRFKTLYRSAQSDIANAKTQASRQDVLDGFLAKIFRIIEFGRVSDSYLMIAMVAIKKFVRRRGVSEENAASIVNGLLIGDQDLESVKPVRALKRLSEFAATDIVLLKVLEGVSNWGELCGLLEQQFPSFYKDLLEYIDLYGDRTIGELKLEARTFRVAPMELIALICVYAQHTSAYKAEDANGQLLRDDAEKRFYLVASGRIERWIGQFLIFNLRKFIRAREYIRLNRARYYGVVRAVYIDIAAQWVAEGRLSDPSDIFFLTAQEVESVIRGETKLDLRSIVSRRHTEWGDYERKEPDTSMWLKGDVNKNLIPQDDRQTNSADILEPGTFIGDGCCPGQITAGAVVLESPDHSVDVKGKIIVAKNTDPGWVFLIMTASGLIMEKGSLLSHTAIIGREMGIPTIVAVKRATRDIPSGSILSMDGSTGLVKIMNENKGEQI